MSPKKPARGGLAPDLTAAEQDDAHPSTGPTPFTDSGRVNKRGLLSMRGRSRRGRAAGANAAMAVNPAAGALVQAAPVPSQDSNTPGEDASSSVSAAPVESLRDEAGIVPPEEPYQSSSERSGIIYQQVSGRIFSGMPRPSAAAGRFPSIESSGRAPDSSTPSISSAIAGSRRVGESPRGGGRGGQGFVAGQPRDFLRHRFEPPRSRQGSGSQDNVLRRTAGTSEGSSGRGASRRVANEMFQEESDLPRRTVGRSQDSVGYGGYRHTSLPAIMSSPDQTPLPPVRGQQQESLDVNVDSETQARDIEDRCGDEMAMYRPPGRRKTYLYHAALKQGCVAVAALAYVQAAELHFTAAAAYGQTTFREIGRNILWSMPRPVLQALVAGNLAHAAAEDEFLGELFSEDQKWMAEAQGNAPVIYVIVLANRAGMSPTPVQHKQVIAMLRKYIADDPRFIDDVVRIDNALNAGRSSRQQVEQGQHRYLRKTTAGKTTIVRGRTEIVELFCDALEARLDRLSRAGEGDIPLVRPLMYVGYAFKYVACMEAHQGGETNFLMQLVRAVCQALFPGEYGPQTFPVCFLAEEDEVRLAELLLTQVANSFSWSGGGFNAHPPGINNSSAELRHWTMEKGTEFWAERRDFRRSMLFHKESAELEMSHLQLRATAIEAPRENISGSIPASQTHYGQQKEPLDVLFQQELRDNVRFENWVERRKEAWSAKLDKVAANIEVMSAEGDPEVVASLKKQLQQARGVVRRTTYEDCLGDLTEIPAAVEEEVREDAEESQTPSSIFTNF